AGALVSAAAELAARWWIRRHTRYHVWPPGTRLELRSDGTVCPQLDRLVRFDVNADGERGREVRQDEAGLFRVLTAGGSSVECFVLNEHASWPGAVERILNAPEHLPALGARRVHGGNIGRPGVSSRPVALTPERVLPQSGRRARGSWQRVRCGPRRATFAPVSPIPARCWTASSSTCGDCSSGRRLTRTGCSCCASPGSRRSTRPRRPRACGMGAWAKRGSRPSPPTSRSMS